MPQQRHEALEQRVQERTTELQHANDVVRADLGNIFRKASDFKFNGMTNTVGLGLRFNTPVGPIGVDYGYLLDPPSFVTASGGVIRQKQGVIHIRFGQSF